MSSIPKIVLKSSTKMSLNERFTAYRQQAQTTFFRQKSQKQASFENTRLAQQMARRPTVIAALRLKKRSLQQRLGQKRNKSSPSSPNIKSRLDLSARTNSVRGRLGGLRALMGRNARRGQRGGFTRPGTSPLIKARLGSSQPAARRFRKFTPTGQRGARRPFMNQRRNFLSPQRRGRGGAVRKTRPLRGRGGWNRAQLVPTKQELDNELDEYMAETKPMDIHFGVS